LTYIANSVRVQDDLTGILAKCRPSWNRIWQEEPGRRATLAYSADDEGPGRFESGIRSELDKLIDESEQAFKTHLGRTRFWRRMDVSLGLPAAITAAAAGATGLASAGGRIPAAIIALVSAALSAAVVFLRAEQQVKSHTELSAAWAALAADASMARNVRLLEPRGLERVSRELRGLYAWRNNLLRGVSSAELPERREAGD
jgi:hypothetical protein